MCLSPSVSRRTRDVSVMGRSSFVHFTYGIWEDKDGKIKNFTNMSKHVFNTNWWKFLPQLWVCLTKFKLFVTENAVVDTYHRRQSEQDHGGDTQVFLNRSATQVL